MIGQGLRTAASSSLKGPFGGLRAAQSNQIKKIERLEQRDYCESKTVNKISNSELFVSKSISESRKFQSIKTVIKTKAREKNHAIHLANVQYSSQKRIFIGSATHFNEKQKNWLTY